MNVDLLSKYSAKYDILQPLLSPTSGKAEVFLLHNGVTVS